MTARSKSQTALGLPIPDNLTTIPIWLTVVGAFALVIVGAIIAQCIGMSLKPEANTTCTTKSDAILTVFTPEAAFLAGLLSPSPIKN